MADPSPASPPDRSRFARPPSPLAGGMLRLLRALFPDLSAATLVRAASLVPTPPGKLGALPSLLWGGVGDGGDELNARPSPTRSRCARPPSPCGGGTGSSRVTSRGGLSSLTPSNAPSRSTLSAVQPPK